MSDTPNPVVSVELPIVLKTVNDFLTALEQPGVNTQTVVDDFKTAVLQEMINSPAMQSALINTIAAAFAQKLQAVQASVTAPAAPTPAAPPTV